MTRILPDTLSGNLKSSCEVKVQTFFVVFLYTAPYKKETKRRGKIVRIWVRTTSYKPSIRIVRIHFDHSQKRNQIFDLLAFFIGPTE